MCPALAVQRHNKPDAESAPAARRNLHLPSVGRHNLPYQEQPQSVALLLGVFIANHIMGSVIQFLDFFRRSPCAVVFNRYDTVLSFGT